MLRSAASEIAISALRPQIPFSIPSPPPPLIATDGSIRSTRETSTVSKPVLGFGRVYHRHSFGPKARSFASKSRLSHITQQSIEVFTGDFCIKIGTARVATARLQENGAYVHVNRDGFYQTNAARGTQLVTWGINGGDTEQIDASQTQVNGDINGQCDVTKLEEYSEEWRRMQVDWLCKELPAHDSAPMIRILNKQRKWIQQEDVKYIITHLLESGELSISHRVYKWMTKQNWYAFDFVLATKLADVLGKDLKIVRCRDVFDEIINQGLVPCESTFIMLIMAYIEAPAQGSVHEACNIYNLMIHVGGYQPSPGLQNSLFKAFLSKTGGASKPYLKQAETVFQNMKKSGFKINRDIYDGLIWLHSYQNFIDREKIASLRVEMQQAGVEESEGLLTSILRVCSRYGDVEEAERTWAMLLEAGFDLTSQVFVYKMEVYAKAGQPMKSLEIFGRMQENGVPLNEEAYQKIIEIMSKAQQKEHAESFLKQFEDSGMKSLQSSYVDLMQMYLSLSMYDEVDAMFSRCIRKCRPNRLAYNVYLESLIKCGNLERAEEFFAGLQKDGPIGAIPQACNTMLECYLATGQEAKIQQLYDEMCLKEYKVEPPLIKRVKPFIRFTLIPEQREILIAMLLCGARIESHDENKTFEVHFEVNQEIGFQNILKTHLHDRFYEWLKPLDRLNLQDVEIPYQFSTMSHSCFRFYGDQFRSEGKPAIPRLIHRWLSPRVLAYWYMYGGHKSTSGDIVLNAQNYGIEETERVKKALKAMAINCFTESQGKGIWIRCHGKDAMLFWKLIEPYILDNLREALKPEYRVTEDGADIKDTGFVSETKFNEKKSDSNCDFTCCKGIEEPEIQSKIFS